MYSKNEIDEMLDSYLGCALWSSLDDNGEPLDEEHDLSDLSDEVRQSAREDCEAFARANAQNLDGIGPASAGHDFWLTRNHHGAGFWDRGYGDLGDRLTESAHVYGGVDLYVGDDGRVYGQ